MKTSVSTPAFAKCIRQLRKRAKKGKDAVTKALAASAEWATTDQIESLKRTNHGESRIPNVRKYDLGAGYRLVTQLVNQHTLAFLFVGDHDETEEWLEKHRSFKWVQSETDLTLEFVRVTNSREELVVTPEVNFDTPVSLLQLPLLRSLSPDEWGQCSLPRDVQSYLQQVTGERWELDPDGIIAHIEKLSSEYEACFAHDLLTAAAAGKWDELRHRVKVAVGTAAVVEGNDAAAAMTDESNSHKFYTWEDQDSLPEADDWLDWMLFMHPEQKDFANRDFKGPARLRGVSGSGKTCVMIHRARRLALKYREPILLVTLTESMRRLLELLVNMLCGAESAHIHTATMNQVATEVIGRFSEAGLKSLTETKRANSHLAAARKTADAHPELSGTVFAGMSKDRFYTFLEDEIRYVRDKFLPEDFEDYLKAPRHGRGMPLPEKARKVVLAAVEAYEHSLGTLMDYAAIARQALLVLSQPQDTGKSYSYRCVLVDEVQDLSQLQLQILARVPHQNGYTVNQLENGLFLVGDGAQSIYARGFTLKRCGISVANRSFVLQKNYRNTREILQAAYQLIARYEFADDDDEKFATPTEPHLSSRHGEKPFLVKTLGAQEEARFVAQQIAEIIVEQRHRDEADEKEDATEIPICVIGFRQGDRDRIADELARNNIPRTELRERVSWEDGAVKISTLESAKGHEFHAVFIVGLNEGTMPIKKRHPSEWKRDAARLYVAMTRARDRLFMSYRATEESKPSVFLASIQDQCQECVWKRNSLHTLELN